MIMNSVNTHIEYPYPMIPVFVKFLVVCSCVIYTHAELNQRCTSGSPSLSFDSSLLFPDIGFIDLDDDQMDLVRPRSSWMVLPGSSWMVQPCPSTPWNLERRGGIHRMNQRSSGGRSQIC